MQYTLFINIGLTKNPRKAVQIVPPHAVMSNWMKVQFM